MTHALQPVRRASPLVVGRPSHWARDAAIVGAATASLAPFLVIFDPAFSLAAGLFGGASGWMLGWFGSQSIDLLRARVPLTIMVCLAPVVGICWGAASGGFGGLYATAEFTEEAAVALGMIFGGIAGGLQLGVLFLPYLVTSTVGGPRWPVLLAALLAAPLLGWGSLMALGMGSMLWPIAILVLPVMAALSLGFELRVLQARTE